MNLRDKIQSLSNVPSLSLERRELNRKNVIQQLDRIIDNFIGNYFTKKIFAVKLIINILCNQYFNVRTQNEL
jgi:hypothetical protein